MTRRLLFATAATVTFLVAVYLTRPTHRLPCCQDHCPEEHGR